IEGDGRLDAGIEAGVGLADAVALDLVEGAQHLIRIGHAIDLAPDARVCRGNRRRVNPEIEKRGVNGSAPFRRELRLDARAARPLEGAHQRAVEEDQSGQLHGYPVWMCRTEASVGQKRGGTPVVTIFYRR